MTQLEFLTAINKNFQDAYKLVVGKNKDYAGEGDPFHNFRGCEALGIPLEKGIMIRMTDKLNRCANLLTSEPQVSSEKIQDTLLDLMNYANILSVYLSQK